MKTTGIRLAEVGGRMISPCWGELQIFSYPNSTITRFWRVREGNLPELYINGKFNRQPSSAYKLDVNSERCRFRVVKFRDTFPRLPEGNK